MIEFISSLSEAELALGFALINRIWEQEDQVFICKLFPFSYVSVLEGHLMK